MTFQIWNEEVVEVATIPKEIEDFSDLGTILGDGTLEAVAIPVIIEVSGKILAVQGECVEALDRVGARLL